MGKFSPTIFSLDNTLLEFMTQLALIGLTLVMHPPLHPSRFYPKEEWWFLKEKCGALIRCREIVAEQVKITDRR